jgi:hypothetical protein
LETLLKNNLKKYLKKLAALKGVGEGKGDSRLELMVGGTGLEPVTPCV